MIKISQAMAGSVRYSVNNMYSISNLIKSNCDAIVWNDSRKDCLSWSSNLKILME